MPKPALPASLTPLLGREQETARVSQLLSRPEVRLVTITGPGGVGKTSLALQVAHDLRDAFTDGVFFISLAPISDPTLILPTIAQTLGLLESPRRLWLPSLQEYLQDRQVLLLLDNFEQIIAAAPLLSELLSACAELRLLVTSREALRVRGEQEFLLSPLALPRQPALETLLECPSVALFVQCAQATQLDFRLTVENAAAVSEICARLDGLPLALELAAARIRLLPPQAMLARLRDSPLQLLAGGARDLPARQHTLRSAIQWSYDLLDDEEQRAFRWCSVFVGGSGLEAALAVLGPRTRLDVLDSLVGKSLLRQSEIDAAPRLTMLETIREFGLQQLASARELDSSRRAHAACYLAFAADAAQALAGPDQKAWLQRLDREQDNLRAALRWTLEQQEAQAAQRLAGALQPFWFARCHWSEGRRWLEEALALDSGAAPDPAVRAGALYGAGVLARFQGDFARARVACANSLALYRALADQTGVLKALTQLVRITAFQGDQDAEKSFLMEAASLTETLPDTVAKADAYTDMAISMSGPDGSQPTRAAARYLAESERIQRALHNPAGLAFALIHQSSYLMLAGDLTLAASRLAEAERLVEELGDARLASRLVMVRLVHDIVEGDFAPARRRLEETFQQIVNSGDHHLPVGLFMLAVILHGQGLEGWSARVLGLTEALTRSRQKSAELAAVAQRLRIGDMRAELRAQLGAEAFAREIEAGHRLKLDDLLAIPHPPEPAPAQPAQPAAHGAALTPREIDVLRLLAQDLSNPQIAERLVVSRRTVDAHLRSIYDKLGVTSRAAAIMAAQAQGMLGRQPPALK